MDRLSWIERKNRPPLPDRRVILDEPNDIRPLSAPIDADPGRIERGAAGCGGAVDPHGQQGR